ncbi:hypothetical protein AKJ13_22355 [Methylobacterium sp. ARG-1]|nr:hypothetical protein AKJ13_22355 [Methylobacterium sp. ARG-1]
MTRPMADLVGRCMNRMEDHPAVPGRKVVSASSAPDEAERAALTSRRAELLTGLRPAPLRDLLPVLVKIIANGDAFGMSREEAIEKAKLYAEAAQGIPVWAMERAQIALGRPGWKSSWNGRGIPSSADVVAECRAVLAQSESELYRLGQILDAEVIDTQTTPEQRAEALARWEATKAEIGRSSAMPGRTEEEIDRERSEMDRANARFRERKARADAAVAAMEAAAKAEAANRNPPSQESAA